jgi:hypothetical protein
VIEAANQGVADVQRPIMYETGNRRPATRDDAMPLSASLHRSQPAAYDIICAKPMRHNAGPRH